MSSAITANKWFLKKMTAPKKDPSIDHYAAFNKAVQNLFENVNGIHLYFFCKSRLHCTSCLPTHRAADMHVTH